MLVRALIAFLVLPGVVAFLAPVTWVLLAQPEPRYSMGFVLIVLGTAMLLWCVRDFYVAGKGTLAPWAPPQHLVVVGLYRYSRNPMYVAVIVILSGWATVFSQLFYSFTH